MRQQFPRRLTAVWDSILSEKNHPLIVNVAEGQIVSSCVCLLIPNLTQPDKGRPALCAH